MAATETMAGEALVPTPSGQKGVSTGPAENRIPPKGGSSTAPAKDAKPDPKKEEPVSFQACATLWLAELHRRSKAFTGPQAKDIGHKAISDEAEACLKIVHLIGQIHSVAGPDGVGGIKRAPDTSR